MSNTQINITENGTTTLATVGKFCDRNIDVNVNVESGGGVPEKLIHYNGDCNQKFWGDRWSWVIEEYGNQITTQDITNVERMFSDCQTLSSVPFQFNFKADINHNCYYMFQNCYEITEIGDLVNIYPSNISSMFSECRKLRYLPKFINLNMDKIYSSTGANMGSMFHHCYSLRSISEELLKRLYTPLATSASNTIFSSFCSWTYVLDEVRGLNPQTGTMTSNMFNYSFTNCYRLKDMIFDKQDDGTVYSTNWKSQTMDLSSFVGYSRNYTSVTGCNSGITADKEVTNDATYQALKNDADWFTCNVSYSRYNHDSAVNTINSLPDTSAYLATAGGTNTIKFKGASGELTDGGAINTLTEEEIAVATAKGWTISLV